MKLPLDFVAWGLTYTSTLALGAHQRWGWIALGAGTALWTYIGWEGRWQGRRIWGLTVGNAITTATAVWNWCRW